MQLYKLQVVFMETACYLFIIYLFIYLVFTGHLQFHKKQMQLSSCEKSQTGTISDFSQDDTLTFFYLVSFQFLFSFEFLYPFKRHVSTGKNNIFRFVHPNIFFSL